MLQQYFVNLTIKQAQAEYEREGIPWEPVDFFDNVIVVDLVGGPRDSVLTVLDEQCAFREASVDRLDACLERQCGPKPRFLSSTRMKGGKGCFGVEHYAGTVKYDSTTFIDKNRDALTQDLVDAVLGGKHLVASALFADRKTASHKTPPTVAKQFRANLKSLLDTISLCRPHYVRCLKPNEEKIPEHVDAALLQHQVRSMGLPEHVRVTRAGYCYRTTFSNFVQRYEMCCRDTWAGAGGTSPDKKRACQLILSGGNHAKLPFVDNGLSELPVFTEDEAYFAAERTFGPGVA